MIILQLFVGILDIQPKVPVTCMKQSQERGRRGKLSYSSNESVYSRTNLLQNRSLNSSNGYLTSSESDTSRREQQQALLSSSGLSESLEVCKESWASLDVGRFTKVDIGEFYSPERFYVMRYNGYNR